MSLLFRLVVLFGLAVVSSLQAAEDANDDFSSRAAIIQRLEQAQTELQQHTSDSDSLTYELLQRLESTIYQHQAAIDLVATQEAEYERAANAKRSWNQFDQPGPYSIVFSDELRMQLISLQDEQLAAEARHRILIRATRDSANQLTTYQRKGREFSEQVENAETVDSGQQALVSLQQTDISSRIEVEKIAYLELRQGGLTSEIAAFTARQELIEQQLASIKDQITFNQSDLDKILTRIADERTQILEELDTPGRDSPGTDARLAWLTEFLDTEESFWKTRFEVSSKTSRANQKQALESFREMSQLAASWIRAGQTLTDNQLLTAKEDTEEIGLRNELSRIKHFQDRVHFMISELEGSASFGMSVLDYMIDTALTFWGAELYVVEDTTSFEGKKITTYRAITYGKLIKLALILTAGWFALKFLSNRMRRLALSRFSNSPDTVNSVARWTFAVGLGLLIIYALKSVNIPFTAFAFLGGTLAIGIGFGAQTLIKNFISGIILLLERPFKVGDYIEVDNVTGQILRIGMRASIIEHFDGIETLIPNGILLDNRVDNWTFGKTSLRGSVTIGVAYDSSTREVTRTLLAAAEKHGQVFDKPEPEVRFEDFGDNALVFRLLYWVDATKTQRERLDSDLRFMILNGLRDIGVTIAYPQRDIHFDSSQPLKIDISSSSNTHEPG